MSRGWNDMNSLWIGGCYHVFFFNLLKSETLVK